MSVDKKMLKNVSKSEDVDGKMLMDQLNDNLKQATPLACSSKRRNKNRSGVSGIGGPSSGSNTREADLKKRSGRNVHGAALKNCGSTSTGGRGVMSARPISATTHESIAEECLNTIEDDTSELGEEENKQTSVDKNSQCNEIGASHFPGRRQAKRTISTDSPMEGRRVTANAIARGSSKSVSTRTISVCEDGKYGGSVNHQSSLTLMKSNSYGFNGQQINKNCRKSRNFLSGGRGLPKKGGAGGKGTWGKLGSEYSSNGGIGSMDHYECGISGGGGCWIDKNDPNYEECDEDGFISSILLKKSAQKSSVDEGLPCDGNGVKNAENLDQNSLISDDQLRRSLESLVLEYFGNCLTSELIETVEEMLECEIGSERRWMLISTAIEVSLDHKPSHRELTSVLISDAYSKIVTQKDIALAFDYLVTQLPDLTLDTPDSPTIIGNFLARAIADDTLPPSFLNSYKGRCTSKEGIVVMRTADTLLNMKHGLVRLDNVWGVGGGIRPVKGLVERIILLLKEYLSSNDVEEAVRCLQDLEVPHFHHELVFEAMLIVLESGVEKVESAIIKLLNYMYETCVLSQDQINSGFQRVFDIMFDIVLDVPNAYSILDRFVLKCRKSGVISTDALVRKLPDIRGRKRFISEGEVLHRMANVEVAKN